MSRSKTFVMLENGFPRPLPLWQNLPLDLLSRIKFSKIECGVDVLQKPLNKALPYLTILSLPSLPLRQSPRFFFVFINFKLIILEIITFFLLINRHFLRLKDLNFRRD